MAESPTARPTDPTDWSTNSTHETGTTSGHRLNGFAEDEVPASNEWNFWRRAVHEKLQWLEGIALRRFATVREGIEAAINAGQLEGFRFETPGTNRSGGWGAETTTKSASAHTGNPSRIACDGVNVYVAQAGTIRAFDCVPSSAAVAQAWSAAYAGDALRIICDGDLVVLVTTANFYAYAASNGTLLDTLARTNYTAAALPISHDGERFVYLYRTGGAGAPSFEVWDVTNRTETEVVADLAWGVGTPLGIAACHASDIVYILGRGGTNGDYWKIRRFDVNAGTGSWLLETTLDETDAQWAGICTDGDRVYLAFDDAGLYALPVAHATGSSSGLTQAVWNAEVEPPNAAAPAAALREAGFEGRIPMTCDERYLYVLWPNDGRVYAYDKFTGGLIGQATSATAVDFASDGMYLWRVDAASQNVGVNGTVRGQTSWVTVDPASDRSQQRRYTNLIAQPLASAR